MQEQIPTTTCGDVKLGKLMGQGGYRRVYEHPLEKGWVIKVAKSRLTIEHNRNEHAVWSQWKDLREHLAPVICISECGRYLVQARGAQSKVVPEDRPLFIEDKRPVNWVIIGGRVVCCDYGEASVIREMLKGEYHLRKK